MYGRYGIDKLYQGLLTFALLLIVINMMTQSSIISGIVMILLVGAYYRVLSKDIYKRQKENTQYLKLIAPVKQSFKLTYKRIKDIQTYRYRKCPNCHQTLRLKRKVGKHQTICPKCKTTMDVNIRF